MPSDVDMIPPLLLQLSWSDILFPAVLSRLNLEDLFRLRATSRGCRDLIEAYFTVIKRLDLSHKKNFDLEKFQLVTDQNHNLRHLNLRGSKWITDNDLRPLVLRTQLLVSLDISECHHLTANCLQAVAVSCKQLQRLDLHNCHWVTPASMEYLSHHQNNLIAINLTGCWELVDQTLIQLLSNFRRLEVLVVANIYSLTDQTLRAVASFCQGLRHLDICGCWRITDAGMKLVAEYCRNIRVLCVSDCRDVTEASLHRFRLRDVQIDRKMDPFLARLVRQRHPQLRVQV